MVETKTRGSAALKSASAAPAPRPRQRLARRSRTRPRQPMVMVAAATAVVAALVFYVAAYAQVATGNYERYRLQQRLNAMKIRHQILDARYNELLMRKRISFEARGSGMVFNAPTEAVAPDALATPTSSEPKP
ncbi:MAG: hypothetical protein IT210_02370 [Armatimonadetes bacterium]|nr:hypothetical protein [Armatimonadota bacterium]